MNTKSKYRERRTWLCVLLFLGMSVQLSAEENKVAGGSPESDVLKMNPFLVSQDSVKGYLATDTLSGSKVGMKIIDVPQTLNVITRAAMDDSGLDDPNSLFEQFAPGVSNLTGPGIEGTNAVI